MTALEYILYGICIFIGYIAFRIAWSFFPNIVSRKDKYHKSNWDLANDRFVYALSRAFICAGFGSFIVYSLFRESQTETLPKKEVNISHITSESQKTTTTQRRESYEKERISYDTPPLPSADTYQSFIKQWDKTYNEKSWSLLRTLYMDYIKIDGKEFSKDDYIAKIQASSAEQPYKQHSVLVSHEELENNYTKCILKQKRHSEDHEEIFDIFLFIKKTEDGNWQIEMEESKHSQNNQNLEIN